MLIISDVYYNVVCNCQLNSKINIKYILNTHFYELKKKGFKLSFCYIEK